jgi:hypothetical protein
LEEAVDLSSDRLLMMMMTHFIITLPSKVTSSPSLASEEYVATSINTNNMQVAFKL